MVQATRQVQNAAPMPFQMGAQPDHHGNCKLLHQQGSTLAGARDSSLLLLFCVSLVMHLLQQNGGTEALSLLPCEVQSAQAQHEPLQPVYIHD